MRNRTLAQHKTKKKPSSLKPEKIKEQVDISIRQRKPNKRIVVYNNKDLVEDTFEKRPVVQLHKIMQLEDLTKLVREKRKEKDNSTDHTH